MNHFDDDIETVALPDAFAQSLLVGASCEAVLVESTGSGKPVGSTGRTHLGDERRGSVVLFRVGRAYVAEIVGDGPTKTVGLAPAEAETYVDLVSRDDEWTVLSADGALSTDRRNAEDAGATAER